MLLMNWLRQQEGGGSVVQCLILAVGIERIQRRIAEVIKGVAMELICALLVIALTCPPAD